MREIQTLMKALHAEIPPRIKQSVILIFDEPVWEMLISPQRPYRTRLAGVFSLRD